MTKTFDNFLDYNQHLLVEKPQVLLFSEEVKQTNENNTGDKHAE